MKQHKQRKPRINTLDASGGFIVKTISGGVNTLQAIVCLPNGQHVTRHLRMVEGGWHMKVGEYPNGDIDIAQVVQK